MQTSRCVSSASFSRLTLILLACQLPAHSISVDRKIRTHFEDPKTAIAVKVLREKWKELFNKKMRDPAAPLDPQHEQWLALLLEAFKSPKREDDEEKKRQRAEKKPVKLSLTRNG